MMTSFQQRISAKKRPLGLPEVTHRFPVLMFQLTRRNCEDVSMKMIELKSVCLTSLFVLASSFGQV